MRKNSLKINGADKKRGLAVWLLLGALCLGACSSGPARTVEEAEKEAVTEKAEGEGSSQASSKEEDSMDSEMKETQEAEAEKVRPRILSLMTAAEYDHVWGEQERLCYTDYPAIWLDSRGSADPETGASAFPELAEALNEMNARSEETAREMMEELEAAAREMEIDGSVGELFWQKKIWVVRADSHALSLLVQNSTYTGGAHGFYGYEGLTFDSESGRQMALSDVVTDPEQAVEMAVDRLEEKYPDTEFFGDWKETIKRELEEGYLTWVAGYQGITFYFDPYELAPYGYGTLTATILYTEAPELFDSRICQVPGAWAVQLAPGMEFDLKEDGTRDQVAASGIADSYGDTYARFDVSVNDQTSSRDVWFYHYNPYVVCGEDLETELLVVGTSSDNDYQVMYIYELDPDKQGFWEPCQIGSTGFLNYVEEKEDDTVEYGTQILTDPKHFVLETRFNLLSTYYGTQRCGLDDRARDEGYLILENPWYDVDRSDEFYLTLLVPLEMEVEDTGESRVFPAGTKLWIIRVEGNDCVVFSTEDQTVCRVYVESEEWPGKIRGVEDMTIDEIFDGMMFAG